VYDVTSKKENKIPRRQVIQSKEASKEEKNKIKTM
tara:strand:- start:320 stop:424 length:105 start_codon:yes stop_codon:yes gene_type:complete